LAPRVDELQLIDAVKPFGHLGQFAGADPDDRSASPILAAAISDDPNYWMHAVPLAVDQSRPA
jgi:hypothetical protein